ncbi:MAG: DNA-processing protein DprA [Kangiellaceae bacterium]|nr:DNA-processing protein DprA [Kangiellaceae bacterium]MCW8999858.1 DNA-processing protein DprA [Kangiellaceae bacterium]
MQGSQLDLSQQSLEHILALKSITGIGDVRALKLLKYFGTAENIFLAPKQELIEVGLNSKIIDQILHFEPKDLSATLNWASQTQNHVIPFGSPYYPELLAQIAVPPIVLFAKGNIEIIESPQIAIVGSRKPSIQGMSVTDQFCQALCEAGYTITSGLALGVDGEAHRAALRADGYTIAVTGTGLERVYPAYHRELAHQIAAKGLLISEKLPHEPITQGSFPQRNRIIAGLSLGTLVVEAAEKSGTLITAQHAMEEGREVFAIPGSIHNPLAKGCHKLIKQGAKLTESIQDLLEDLPNYAPSRIANNTDPRPQLDEESQVFLKHIDFEVTSLDQVVTRSGLTVDAAVNKLLLLELQGWVVNTAGGYLRR